VHRPDERSLSDRLTAELRACWAAGDRVEAHALLARHPELAEDEEAVLDLAFEEVCLHRDAGEPIDRERICRQFPQFEVQLRDALHTESYFEGRPRLLVDAPAAAEPPPTELTAPEQPPAWPQPGETLLGFTLRHELGRGAFARVFLATEPALGHRQVAVKVSRQGLAEAETLGQLNHPNIVAVHSVQQDPRSGLTVVCMACGSRATLHHVLSWVAAAPRLPTRASAILEAVRAQAPAEEADDAAPSDAVLARGSYVDGVVHLGVQLAGALAFVHARGICHRDLKPANVLLSPTGRPMLLDFNLAANDRLAPPPLGGTVPYMAPEQLRALDRTRDGAGEIGPRADLYALGLMLYELLAGRHPFGPLPRPGSLEELCRYLLDRQAQGVPPLCHANPGVDPGLARVVERCLAFDPADRFATAADLVAALRRCLTPVRRLRRWASTRPRLVLGGLLLGLAAASVGAYTVAVQDPYPVSALKRGLEEAHHGRDEAALGYLNRSIQADPNNPAAFLARGRVYLRRSDFRAAIEDYRRADALAPAGATRARLGYCLSLWKDHTAAIRLYSQALAEGYEDAAVLNNLAVGYLESPELPESEKWLKAHEALTRAIRLESPSPAPLYNHALICLEVARRKPKGAYRLPARLPDLPGALGLGIAEIHRAITRDPQVAEFYYTAACFHCLAAQPDRTRQVLLGVPWGLDPFASAARLQACLQLSDHPEVVSALQCLQRAVEAGQDPACFSEDPVLRILRFEPRFQAVLRQQPPHPPRPVPRLVDPCPD
jgi:tetratricopeptide (TPR) repeat protein